jgi:hypothetical protein
LTRWFQLLKLRNCFKSILLFMSRKSKRKSTEKYSKKTLLDRLSFYNLNQCSTSWRCIFFDCRRSRSIRRVAVDAVAAVVWCFIWGNWCTLSFPPPPPSSTLSSWSTFKNMIRSTNFRSKWFVRCVDTVFGPVLNRFSFLRFSRFVPIRFAQLCLSTLLSNHFAMRFVLFGTESLFRFWLCFKASFGCLFSFGKVLNWMIRTLWRWLSVTNLNFSEIWAFCSLPTNYLSCSPVCR